MAPRTENSARGLPSSAMSASSSRRTKRARVRAPGEQVEEPGPGRPRLCGPVRLVPRRELTAKFGGIRRPWTDSSGQAAAQRVRHEPRGQETALHRLPDTLAGRGIGHRRRVAERQQARPSERRVLQAGAQRRAAEFRRAASDCATSSAAGAKRVVNRSQSSCRLGVSPRPPAKKPTPTLNRLPGPGRSSRSRDTSDRS